MRWLLRHLWLPPLGFALLVLVTGFWTQSVVHAELDGVLAHNLTTIRDSTAAALTEWMKSRERVATVAARDPEVRQASRALIERFGRGATFEELAHAPEQERLRELLAEPMAQWDIVSFVLVVDETIISTSRPEQLGLKVSRPGAELARRLRAGETILIAPVRVILAGREETLPLIRVAAPVADAEGAGPLCYLSFRIDPEDSFSRILQIAQFGQSGETYAFGPEGLLLSNTRLVEDLRNAGLLGKKSSPILRVQLRDPGVDLTRGQRPLGPIEERPLTHSVSSALAGGQGVDTHGYRDFRGVESVGAWLWLPRYHFGIATEIDQKEAYRTLTIVQGAMFGLVGMLVLAAAAIAVASRIMNKLRETAERAERLGQYTLEERIGQGGMGTVYRAKHALLRRPTALKVIRAEDATDTDRKRFEIEVQATSQLTHPNVVAIYDYGRTASGVFYYAMEYLEGITLAELVSDDGAQPQGRVLCLLRQMCGALAEAHSTGLIHRDIKPANMMLCVRGGLYDVIKVLDFGLAKGVRPDEELLTAVNAIPGTPHYIAPEVIQDPASVDARSDVYAVAAVAFFLLTGREMFQADSVLGVLTAHVTTPPPRPSSISTEPLHPGFEELLLECLDRDPASRPADAGALLARLDALATEPTLEWPQASAKAWWMAHGRALRRRTREPLLTSPTLSIDWENRSTSTHPPTGSTVTTPRFSE